MGLDEGEVGEAHGLVPDCGGAGARLADKAAGLPRKRQQTGMVLGPREPGAPRPGPACAPIRQL